MYKSTFKFSQKRKFDFMRVVYYTFVIIVTLIIVGRASSVRNCLLFPFSLSFCTASFAMELFITYVKEQPSHSL